MNWKSNKKLRTAVLAGVLALNFGSVNNVYADGIIGQGNYSWDKNWSITLSYDLGNPYETTTRTYLEYTASTGKLVYHKIEYDDDQHTSDHTYITLGDAKTILGGMSEEDILDIVDDAIHNVQGDQTVNGSQDITGDQTVEGEQTVNGGQTVTGGLLLFLKSNKKWAANAAQTEMNNDERGI